MCIGLSDPVLVLLLEQCSGEGLGSNPTPTTSWLHDLGQVA